jgi:uncharacterized protein YjbI with pentapeptide repeats
LLSNCAGCNVSNVDLLGKNLQGIKTAGSNFSGSNLSGTSLRGAQLIADNFSGANLQNADLNGVTLCGHETNWNGGDFTVGTRVFCTNLRDADLRGADLRGVQLCDPVKGNGDRRECSPLDAATLRDVAHANLTGAKGP